MNDNRKQPSVMSVRDEALEIWMEMLPSGASGPKFVDALIAANLISSVSPATAWDEGATWMLEELASDPTRMAIRDGDNPYRSPATTKGN